MGQTVAGDISMNNTLAIHVLSWFKLVSTIKYYDRFDTIIHRYVNIISIINLGIFRMSYSFFILKLQLEFCALYFTLVIPGLTVDLEACLHVSA